MKNTYFLHPENREGPIDVIEWIMTYLPPL